jgi:hypothetical protein
MPARVGGVYVDVSPELAPGFASDSEQLVRRGLSGLDDVARAVGARMGNNIGDGLDDGGRRGAAAMEDSFQTFTRGADGRLRDSLGRFVSEARAAGGDAGEGLADGLVDGVEGAADDVGSSFGPAGLIGGAIVGAAVLVGAKFMQAFTDSAQREVSADALAFRLGLTPAESEHFGRIAGELYAQAYGASVDDVNRAIESIRSTLSDVLPWTENALEGTTKKLLDLETGFQIPAETLAQSARILVDQGAGSVESALDQLFVALKLMPSGIRDELTEISDEYAQFATALGIPTDDFLAGLASAADKGKIVLDKYGDALKEFGIRAADGSQASADAYEAAGLEAEEYFDVFAQGGPIAEGALQEVAAGLLAIEDPSYRAEQAIALFGTPLEDLNTSEIPKFLEALVDMGGGLGDVEGALDDAGATLNDNAATWWETLKRGFMRPFNDWMDSEFTPRAGRLLEAFQTGGFEGLGREWSMMWENEIKPGIDEALAKFGVWWDETGKPWLKTKLGEWIAAGGEWIVTSGVPMLMDLGMQLQAALIRGFGEGIAAAAEGIWSGVVDAASGPWTRFATWWNSLRIPQIGPWHLTGPFGWSLDLGPWGPFDLPDIGGGAAKGATSIGSAPSQSFNAGGGVRVMADGGFLTGPTMIRPNTFGGEAGPEVVVPLDRFETWFDRTRGRGATFTPTPAQRPGVYLERRRVGDAILGQAARHERLAS